MKHMPEFKCAVAILPGDVARSNHPRQVPGACFSFAQPTAVPQPKLIGWTEQLAGDLGLPQQFNEAERLVDVFSGNTSAIGSTPYAMRYGGHQFGHWAGQLGDGRVIALGELSSRHGASQELQLKGAGPTPYSRRGDGRAVLRSSVREFMCSEAMHNLGVPTTRALSLVTTGEEIWRDLFYDGNPATEPGAIVCRVAPSFLRFGNFEILSHEGATPSLRKLCNYTIERFFPEYSEYQDRYAKWFIEVCKRTAILMVNWMRVGFVHGVMNTDNMSVLGLTIDYGPYGWIEKYDPMWTPNTTDFHGRRYCFGRQAHIAQWNLERLADSLRAIIAEDVLQQGIRTYRETFISEYRATMLKKMGVASTTPIADDELITHLVSMLVKNDIDMTVFFRQLAKIDINADRAANFHLLESAFYAKPDVEDLDPWFGLYQERLQHELNRTPMRIQQMNQINPKFIFRNHIAYSLTKDLEKGNISELKKFQNVFQRPYDEQPEFAYLAEKSPEWARTTPGCSTLSCSS